MEVVKGTKPLFKILIVIAVVLFCLGITWVTLASPVDKNNTEGVEVIIKPGTSKSEIASILKEKNLIRSKYLFQVYVLIQPIDSLKADAYLLNRTMSLGEIVNQLEKGSNYNPNMIKLTFKEGLRIVDYAKLISENTNNTYEDTISVFKDKEYTRSLINKYWFLTDKILNENIYYPLEGYLAPDTYHFNNKDVTVKEIIETMLDEKGYKLSKYKEQLSKDVHYYMTMASIVELEGTNTSNRKMIVGIFKNRMASGMNMGSDVTTYYALQKPMTSDLSSGDFLVDNPYNTRSVNMIGKMPVGPICSFDYSSLEASISPTASDYLFFVADKNGNIYYTRTNQEHDKKIAEIKAKGDWIW